MNSLGFDLVVFYLLKESQEESGSFPDLRRKRRPRSAEGGQAEPGRAGVGC